MRTALSKRPKQGCKGWKLSEDKNISIKSEKILSISITHFIFVILPIMQTNRQNRLGRQLQKDIGDVFQRFANDIYPGAMITITKVRLTGDLSIARVYLSVFAVKDKSDVLETVRAKSNLIKNELAKKIKNQVRKIPELEFYEDDSLDYIENIDQLLKE